MNTKEFSTLVASLVDKEVRSRNLTETEMLQILFFEFLKEEKEVEKDEYKSGN